MARIRSINSYARRGPIKEPYDTVLIVCEGAKTEPNYFNGLKGFYRLSSANIEVTKAPGTDPMSVVKYSEALMNEEKYDRVFSVFDRDGHANFAEAVSYVSGTTRGQAGTWHAITSTPSFEVWLMLHYQYSTAPIVAAGGKSAGEMAVHSLRTVLPGYSKGDKEIFQKTSDNLETAIRNGARLETHNVGSQSNNPATNMHILIDYLRKLKTT